MVGILAADDLRTHYLEGKTFPLITVEHCNFSPCPADEEPSLRPTPSPPPPPG